MRDLYQRGDAREPILKPGHRRCACQEEIPMGQWTNHIDQCTIRIQKQVLAAEKAKKKEST